MTPNVCDPKPTHGDCRKEIAADNLFRKDVDQVVSSNSEVGSEVIVSSGDHGRDLWADHHDRTLRRQDDPQTNLEGVIDVFACPACLPVRHSGSALLLWRSS